MQLAWGVDCGAGAEQLRDDRIETGEAGTAAVGKVYNTVCENMYQQKYLLSDQEIVLDIIQDSLSIQHLARRDERHLTSCPSCVSSLSSPCGQICVSFPSFLSFPCEISLTSFLCGYRPKKTGTN
jgi:hypothetical protein